MLENVFHLKENHTDAKTEIMAGIIKVSAFVCTQNGAMPILPKEFTR